MFLLFINIDLASAAILVTYLLVVILVANFGQRTALGYRATLLISLFASPVTALIIVLLFRRREMRKR